MTEEQLKIEARLTAIEYVLSDLCAKWSLANRASPEKVTAAHHATIERLKIETFPGLDPATADAFAAEFEDAVSNILSMQRALLIGLYEKIGKGSEPEK